MMDAPSKHGITKRGYALIFIIFCWFALLLIGNSLYSGIKAQGVSGFPNFGQLKLYILFPTVMIVGNILIFVLSKKLPRALTIAVVMVQIIPALVAFLLFGGGL